MFDPKVILSLVPLSIPLDWRSSQSSPSLVAIDEPESAAPRGVAVVWARGLRPSRCPHAGPRICHGVRSGQTPIVDAGVLIRYW